MCQASPVDPSGVITLGLCVLIVTGLEPPLNCNCMSMDVQIYGHVEPGDTCIYIQLIHFRFVWRNPPDWFHVLSDITFWPLWVCTPVSLSRSVSSTCSAKSRTSLSSCRLTALHCSLVSNTELKHWAGDCWCSDNSKEHQTGKRERQI